jgi:hypothetical protein
MAREGNYSSVIQINQDRKHFARAYISLHDVFVVHQLYRILSLLPYENGYRMGI